MKNNKFFDSVHPKDLLSTLWIFFLFCIFFSDFQWIVTPGSLEEISSGFIRGNEMTQDLLFIASVVHVIPVLMVLLSQVMKRTINRWLNISMGTFTLLLTFSSGWDNPDQIFFKVVEVIGLLLIVWYAWKWPKQGEQYDDGHLDL